MGHITKIAAVENATAVWEYDPTREDNRVLGGSLDVIAAIRTLAIKVSGMRHENLHLTQVNSKLAFHRSRPLDSVLSTSKAPRSTVDFLKG